MRLLLISLILMSLTSIAVPLRAEQQICELEVADRKMRKEMGLKFTEQGTFYIPNNCEEGDLLFVNELDQIKMIEQLFIANCKNNTYQKVWNNKIDGASMRCIYRGKGNELKRRNGRPSNPFEKEKKKEK